MKTVTIWKCFATVHHLTEPSSNHSNAHLGQLRSSRDQYARSQRQTYVILTFCLKAWPRSQRKPAEVLLKKELDPEHSHSSLGFEIIDWLLRNLNNNWDLAIADIIQQHLWNNTTPNETSNSFRHVTDICQSTPFRTAITIGYYNCSRAISNDNVP